MGFAVLIAGLVVLLGAHVFVARRATRSAVIARIGEWPYKALFSLVSLAGLALIVIGFALYRRTGWIEVWTPPAWTRYAAIPLVWLAFVCIVSAYFPGDIKRRLKHPMLVGVKLWAVAHLLANGDLGSIMLFGLILGWAVFDRISLKRRTDASGPPIPIGGRKNDMVAILIGTILFAAFGYVFHPLWIGVPVFGTSPPGT
jgi:uncharacterized membrane protein